MGLPRLVLLDARCRGLDPAGLRRWAREVSATREGRSSRSYRYPLALVGWHHRPLGVDLERVEPCEPSFAELICTPWERALLAGAADPDRFLASLWSSKEALAKLLGDPLHSVPSQVPSPLSWPDDHHRALRAAPVALPDGFVGWACWRATPPQRPDPALVLRPALAEAEWPVRQPAGVAAASTQRWPSQRTEATHPPPSQ